VQGVIEPVAEAYAIPYEINRGYTSIPPRRDLVRRFLRSGKDRLVLLQLTDHDPEGQDIAHSFARSLRDDFGITNLVPVKVALNERQVRELNLPPQMKAKQGSSRRKRFVEQYGDNVYELEAVPPEVLQNYLRQAIDSYLDVRAFNAELDAEKKDAARLEVVRRQIIAEIGDSSFEDE
jgi:hypothetical protein